MSRTSERLLTKASGTRGTGRWPVLPHGRVQRPDREAFLRRACHPRGLAAARNPGERKQMQTGVMLCECGTYRGPSPTAAESVLTQWREQRSCPRGNPGVVTRNASRVWGQVRPPARWSSSVSLTQPALGSGDRDFPSNTALPEKRGPVLGMPERETLCQ